MNRPRQVKSQTSMTCARLKDLKNGIVYRRGSLGGGVDIEQRNNQICVLGIYLSMDAFSQFVQSCTLIGLQE